MTPQSYALNWLTSFNDASPNLTELFSVPDPENTALATNSSATGSLP